MRPPLAADPEVFAAAARLVAGNGSKRDRDLVRIAKLKAGLTVKEAELRGLRRKMPLTGRAALEALKSVR